MEWWIWIVLALVLFGAEAVTPGGFVVVFFGVGALAAGVLAWAEAVPSLWAQGLTFSIVACLSLVFFRGRLLSLLKPPPPRVDSLVGEVGILLDDVAPGDVGKVELRGTAWNARTNGPALARGQRCQVERVEGLTLWVVVD